MESHRALIRLPAVEFEAAGAPGLGPFTARLEQPPPDTYPPARLRYAEIVDVSNCSRDSDSVVHVSFQGAGAPA